MNIDKMLETIAERIMSLSLQEESRFIELKNKWINEGKLIENEKIELNNMFCKIK